MRRTIAAVFVLITGCGALENYHVGEQYPPSPPPDPTEAILAGQNAATRPSPPAHVLVVPFPETNRRPVDTVEPPDAVEPLDGFEIIDGDEFAE